MISSIFLPDDTKKTKENINIFLTSGGKVDVLIQQLSTPHFSEKEMENEVLHLNLYRILLKCVSDSEKKIEALFHARIEKNKSNSHLLYYFSLDHRFYKLAEQFLKSGCDINTQESGEKGAALHLACLRMDPESVDWLLKHGAKADVKTKEKGETPFHIACANGDVASMEKLFSNQKSNAGNSGLHYAASYGHVDAIRFLLGKGVEVDDRNNSLQTPLDLALNENTVQVLLDHGAVLEPAPQFHAIPKERISNRI